jgi:hypothetical protein
MVTARRLLGDHRVARLRDLPGVTGLSVGLKMVGGRYTDQPAVVVSVRRKLPSRRLRPAERVPGHVAGWPTDVQEELDPACFRVTQTTATMDLTHVRPLRSGIAVSPSDVHAGTLGFFATRQPGSQAVLVSNYHVLYRDRDLLEGEPHPVYQPLQGPDTQVADMDGDHGDGAVGGELDCAFATLSTETTCCCCHTTIPHENKAGATSIAGVNHAAVDQVVTKTGISTGRTVGKVVDVSKEISGAVDYSAYNLPAGGSFTFDNLIMVVTWDPVADDFLPEVPFSAGGDSGSVLLNGDNEIVGLHFLSYHNPQDNRRFSFACHIQKVEQELGIEVAGRRYGTPPPAGPTALAGFSGPIDSAAGEFDITGGRPGVEATWRRVRSELERTDAGRAWLAFLDRWQHEIVRLVNHRRPVTLRWHRLQGPAFTAAVVRSARVPGYRVPAAIAGVTADELVKSMTDVLLAEGSPGLRAEVARLGPALAGAIDPNLSAATVVARLSDPKTTTV